MNKKKILIILGAFVSIIIILCVSVVIWYNLQTKAVTKEQNYKTIEIETGTSTTNIVALLKENNLIKNELATKVYIKLNEITNLQAGKYNLSSNMSLKEVLQKLQNGNTVNEEIKITFLEGKNIRYIASTIANKTNNTEQDVYNLLNDDKYISNLIKKYWFITNEINNKNIYYTLEGYLYPDTYSFKNKDVTVQEIFEVLLNKMEKVLDDYKAKINKSKYSVHEILSLASVVELEGNKVQARNKIAGVFYNRLSKNISLGSDVTTYYAFKIDMGERDLYTSEIKQYNPYNTRGPNMEGKLPVGPICCISKTSIEAVLNPEESNYYYFVADINGDVYFSETYSEHTNMITKLRREGLWYEYDN